MANINHQLQFAPSNGETAAPTSASGSAALRPMIRRPPTATLPCVDAIERHELMLLRMGGNAKSRMKVIKNYFAFFKFYLFLKKEGIFLVCNKNSMIFFMHFESKYSMGYKIFIFLFRLSLYIGKIFQPFYTI
jgi:hypothetical protein